MSILYFRLGDAKGFRSKLVSDVKEGFGVPIRELLQNAIDATNEKDGKRKKCEVEIFIETIKTSDIPHIDEYRSILEKGKDTAKEKGSFNNAKNCYNRLYHECHNVNKMKIMLFLDNGKGLDPQKLEGLLSENSVKDNADSGGSFGVGHLTSYSLSSLRYVLYATKYREKNKIKSIYTGSPILAGYIDRDGETAERGNRGRIVENKPLNEMAPDYVYPDHFPDKFIDEKMKQITTGTLVGIIGLTEDWNDEAEYAIASNFFPLLNNGNLTVKVHDKSTRLIHEHINQILDKKKDRVNRYGENVLSGEQAHFALRAIRNGTRHQIEVIEKTKDSERNKIHVYIGTSGEQRSTVSLIRNGMLIARHDDILSISQDLYHLRNNSSFVPFSLVIEVNNDAKTFLELVKAAETQYHNKLQAKNLSKGDIERLQYFFKEISDEVAKLLKTIDREEVSLEYGTKIAVRGQRTRPSTTARKYNKRPSTKKKKNKKSKQSRSNKSRFGLCDYSAVKKENEDGKHWDIELQVSNIKYNPNKDKLYFSMFVSEDQDYNARKFVNFENATICETNSKQSKKAKINNKQVVLQNLRRNSSYIVNIKATKIDELGVIDVALVPLFSLYPQLLDKETKNE